jgi:hypothetical protein
MKRKNLVVGLDVAVGDGGSIYRAVILELDTQWTWSYFAGYHRSPRRLTGQAAVVELNSDSTWRPHVIACRQILMSWSDYEAQQQRERDDRERKFKAEQAQREKYEKLRSRCAELLGCAVSSSRLGYAEVALNDLYAIACAVKGQKE